PADGGDDVAAHAVLRAIGGEPRGAAFPLPAAGEVVAHHQVAGMQLLAHGIGKVLPGHTHHVLVEVDGYDAVDSENVADYLRALLGGVYERHFHALYQRIRVRVEGEHRGDGLL